MQRKEKGALWQLYLKQGMFCVTQHKFLTQPCTGPCWWNNYMEVFMCGNRTAQQNQQRNLTGLVGGGVMLLQVMHCPTHEFISLNGKENQKWSGIGMAWPGCFCSSSPCARVESPHPCGTVVLQKDAQDFWEHSSTWSTVTLQRALFVLFMH